MEKILLVINARRPDTASFDFACRIASVTGSKLTGLFIENLFYSDPPATYDVENYFDTVEPKGDDTLVATDTEQAVRLFVQECALHNVPALTYIDKGEPIQEVLYESRFADLLIIDPKINFYRADEQLPSHFTKEILLNAECPVLLSPEKSEEINEVVFCYDGTASSVYAMKQFTYLFPQYNNKKAVLLEVNKTGKEEFNDDHRRLMEWLRAHYTAVNYQMLKGNAKDELFTYFFMNTAKLVVMGSYGRGVFSNFFKRSTADVLIRTVDLPIFITHKE